MRVQCRIDIFPSRFTTAQPRGLFSYRPITLCFRRLAKGPLDSVIRSQQTRPLLLTDPFRCLLENSGYDLGHSGRCAVRDSVIYAG